MAPDSYDDQYEKCPSEMENKLMNLTTDGFKERYNFTWENATNRWKEIEGSLKPLPNGFKDKYGIALIAYTANSSLYEDFGPAVREGGNSREYYEKCFTFKSFHFLLTRASQVLKGSKKHCYDVYRGTRDKRFTVSINARVRFGQFTSSSLSQQAAQKFGEDTFFKIETCLGNNIIKFSYFPEQQEILIPPYEVFKVKDVTNVAGKTQITLDSVGKHSNFNCGFKRGQKHIRSVDNQRESPNWLMRTGYSGMDTQSLAALKQMKSVYLNVKCNGSSSLTPGFLTSFLLWGFLLFSGTLHSMGSP